MGCNEMYCGAMALNEIDRNHRIDVSWSDEMDSMYRGVRDVAACMYREGMSL